MADIITHIPDCVWELVNPCDQAVIEAAAQGYVMSLVDWAMRIPLADYYREEARR